MVAVRSSITTNAFSPLCISSSVSKADHIWALVEAMTHKLSEEGRPFKIEYLKYMRYC